LELGREVRANVVGDPVVGAVASEVWVSVDINVGVDWGGIGDRALLIPEWWVRMGAGMEMSKTKLTAGAAETLRDAGATARAAKEYLRVKCMAREDSEELDRLEVS
jgi:hypothetical protein